MGRSTSLFHGLFGFVEQGELLLLPSTGLFFGLRTVDGQVQKTDILLNLGDLLMARLEGDHIGENTFEGGG